MNTLNERTETTQETIINLNDCREMIFWTDRLGISSLELRQIVAKVGNMTSEVKQHLQRLQGFAC